MADPTFVQPKPGTGAVFLHNANNLDAASQIGSFKEGQVIEFEHPGIHIHTCKVYVSAENVTLSADGKSISLPLGSSVNLRSSNSTASAANILSIWSNTNLSLELIGTADGWHTARVYVGAEVVSVLAPGQQPTTPTVQSGPVLNPADFSTTPLVPHSPRLAPSNAGFKAVVASKIWNMYGNLIEVLSQKINIDPALAVAVIATESGGQASGAAGRMTIRFENHLFWYYWGKDNSGAYNQLFEFDPTVKWRGHKYRPNSGSVWLDVHTNQDSEYAALVVARNLNNVAALGAISMGLVQILGSNFAACGYPSVEAMFNSFSAEPRNQLIGFFNFIAHDPAKVTAMQQKDYAAFATRYNGGGQVELYAGLIRDYVDAFAALTVQ
jgi:hypothetical protein